MIKADLVAVEDNTPYMTLTFSRGDFLKFKRYISRLGPGDMGGLSYQIWNEIKDIGDE